MFKSVCAVMIMCLVLAVPSVFAGSGQDTQAQIEALQAQIKQMQEQYQNQLSSVQAQLDAMKEQLLAQQGQANEKDLKIAKLEEKLKPDFDKAFKSGSFKLRDAMGLEEESMLNIGGEINMRYRQNMAKEGANPGFQLYEVELFLDSAVNKNSAFFVELPIMHSNKPDLGNTWVDFHSEGELAATGSTGLMVGHFMPWFGYYGYDDNQSWIYGGRTTTSTTLIRSLTIDSQIMRDRQVGIGGNLKLGSWLLTGQVFNGAGPYIVSGGTDNDHKKDIVGRIQYTLLDELGVVGAGAWYAPKTRGATTNSAGANYASGGKKHVRDINRYVVYFKYPDVMQATLPDLSLGGKPFVLYGEYHWGTFNGNSSVAAFSNDLNYQGAWLETDFNIKRDKLVGICRADWVHPDSTPDQSLDRLWGITPGIKWQFLNQMYLTAAYEYYQGSNNAGNKDDDRITLEMSTQF